jgi:ABC-type protease/lipase transport system fused ATPase/permease subunit
MGYLPQDVELFEGTVAENIARFREVDPDEVVRAAKRAGAHEMILRLPDGYDTEIGASGQSLSGGQRQRVGLARALYNDVRVVLLDEPNANLDTAGEKALLNALAEIKKEGVSVIMITHRPPLLGTADKVLALDNGQVQAFGPRQEVLQKYTRPAAVGGGNRQQQLSGGQSGQAQASEHSGEDGGEPEPDQGGGEDGGESQAASGEQRTGKATTVTPFSR